MLEIIISISLVLGITRLWVVHWYFALFMQAFFNHRFMTHRQFKMSRDWEIFFYMLSFVAQGAGYLSMRAYVILHRAHHAHSDKERDPHSPRYLLTITSLIWNMGKRHKLFREYGLDLPAEQEEKIINKLDDKTKDWLEKSTPFNPAIFNNLPEPSALDTFFDLRWCRYAWMVLWAIPYIVTCLTIWFFGLWPGLYALCLLYPAHLLMIPIQGTLVNWFGHSKGSKNFDNDDDSTNAYFLNWFLWGEENQNNHHHAPARPNFAFKKTERDVIYRIMLILKKYGVIQMKSVENNL